MGCATLEQGVAWCRDVLGVEPEGGGRHPLMGTHNRLLAIAGPAGAACYLELLAIDPAAADPGRPRWFGLDDPALQTALAAAGPRLIGWVVRSQMLDMHRWGLLNSRLQPGDVLKAERETPAGLLRWQIVVREDGRLLLDGAVPTLIQWQGPHPTTTLAPPVLALERLTVRGLPDQAAQVLRLRGVQRGAAPGSVLELQLVTPLGRVTLASEPPMQA